jgi:hypothetical protein
MLVPLYPWKIVQTPEEVVVLYENFTRNARQIFTDGREFPAQMDRPGSATHSDAGTAMFLSWRLRG